VKNLTTHWSLSIVVAAILYLSAYSTALAAPSVTLKATLTPEQLGRETTIGFGFQIATSSREVPPPLTGVEISYPVDLGFALSELGLATCSKLALEIFGPEGCPPNSLMGYGTALAEIPIGALIIREAAQVTIVRTTNTATHLALLIYVDAGTPVSEEVVSTGLILPAPPPYGGRLAMRIPLVLSLPGAPDVAIVKLSSTLGPLHLIYHEDIHGHTITYKPKGIPLPDSCPRGGFPFSAKFAFLGGSQSEAIATVPCPTKKRV
jgi:hypothetical protein